MIDLLAVESDILAVGRRVADLVRAAPDGAAGVKGLTWSIAEVAAHVATVLDWRSYAAAVFDVSAPGLHPAYNEQKLRQFTERDLGVLARVIEDRAAEAVEQLGDDANRRVYEFGIQRTIASYAGLLLGELVIHGRDLARTLHQRWPISPDRARTVFYAGTEVLPYLVDRDVARGLQGVYEIRLRRGMPIFIRVNDSRVSVSLGDPPGYIDLHVSGEPVAYMLVGYGRMSEWRAALTGKIVTWGPRPWLALPLRRLFVKL